MVVANWKKIFNFGSPSWQDDRDRILFQTLTLYVFNLFDMPQTEIKALSEDLPDPENSWVDAIPEIFGQKWKRAGLREGRKEGRAEGRAEEKRSLTIKTIQKFPNWTDEEVADFVDASAEYIQQLRREIKEQK